jgi:hypothetical protein
MIPGRRLPDTPTEKIIQEPWTSKQVEVLRLLARFSQTMRTPRNCWSLLPHDHCPQKQERKSNCWHEDAIMEKDMTMAAKPALRKH